MKSIAIGLLFMGGLLAAQDQPAQEQQPARQAHLNQDQREALRTQSPPVKTHSRKHANKSSKYVVTKNKSTIVATKPYNPDNK